MCHCIWLTYMHKRCHPQGRGTRHNNQNTRHPGGDYEYVTPYVHINHCHDLGRNVVVTDRSTVVVLYYDHHSTVVVQPELYYDHRTVQVHVVPFTLIIYIPSDI